MSHFLSHRVARNGETLGRMTKCQNFPEVFAIQSEWVRDAADDYLREMSKLMEVNSRIMSGMLGSLGQVGMPSAVEMPTSPVAHSAFETAARLMRARIRDARIARGALGTRDTDPAPAAFITGKVYSEGRRLAV